MSSIGPIFRRLRALFLKEKLDAEMSEEMRAHLEMQEQATRAAGMSADEAHYAAQRQFGGIDQIKERARDQRGWVWAHQFSQDLRYALRQLRQAPGFTATVVVTLALGIGACTTVFSVVDAILLHPETGGVDPARQVFIGGTLLPRITGATISVPDILDLEKEAKSFALVGVTRYFGLNLTGGSEPQSVNAVRFSPRCFEILGLRTCLGRTFLPEDGTVGKGKVIILGYQIWQSAFGGDPQVIGRTVQVNGEPYTVVGVATAEWARQGYQVDAFVPMVFTDPECQQRGGRFSWAFGQLKPGVTLAQAQAELDVIAAGLARQYPDTNTGRGFSLVPVAVNNASGLRPILWTLLGAVGGVLLIVCANVANLLLARANTRQREMSVRAALGAGRGRLARQLLTESILLALLGGGVGLLVAQWTLALVHAYADAPGMVRLQFVELNPGMLAFALGLSLATGIIFGLAPAWLGSAADLNENLKQGTRGNTEAGERGRLRSGLVVIEVAGTLVLLVGAGLLLRSFVRLTGTDPGYVPERVTIMEMRLPGTLAHNKYSAAAPRNVFVEAVLARLRTLPEVQAAGAVNELPPTNQYFTLGFAIENRPDQPAGDWPTANHFIATPGYFSAIGIRLLRGRLFTEQDNAQAPGVVLISATLARQYSPDADPLGQHLKFTGLSRNDKTSWEIVGIVNDVSTGVAGTEMQPQVYMPFAQKPGTVFRFVIRSRGNPAALWSSLKQQVYAVDKDQPVQAVRPLAELMDGRVINQRFTLHLLGIFALVALVIAAVGIFGVMAYNVSQRTTEIGIRMALGAQTRDVLRLVFGHGARLVGLGLLLGLIASFAAGRAIESMLYHVSARDPLTLVVITLLLCAVAALACLLPARRAVKIDPMIALRAE